MASSKQTKDIKNINSYLKEVDSSASNTFGIMALANQELLDGAHSILYEIQNRSLGEKIDFSHNQNLGGESGLLWAEAWLTSIGYDISNLRLEDLLSKTEIEAIEIEVNRPLVDRIKWDRWDYIFTFGAAIMGSAADFLWGDPTKGLSKYLSDKDTLVGGWFENIHSLHHSNSPMDFQGVKMGGGDHRLRSIGHDLFGFLRGIWQIKNGNFTGGYFDHGRWHDIVEKSNQFGKPYDQMGWDEAIWYYSVHVFCDFFSSKSLPVPGFGYLAQMPYRDMRKFAHEMYSNGYNLRHMFIQGLSVGIVELIVRTYFYLKYPKYEIPKEQLLLKENEMRLLAHSLVTAFNIGKVIITKNPLNLNLPQILFTMYQFWPFIIDYYRRNDEIQIILRNLNDLECLSKEYFQKIFIIPLSTKEFGVFLSEKPILI